MAVPPCRFFDFGRRFMDVSERGRLRRGSWKRCFFDFGSLFIDNMDKRYFCNFRCASEVRQWPVRGTGENMFLHLNIQILHHKHHLKIHILSLHPKNIQSPRQWSPNEMFYFQKIVQMK